MKLQIARHTDIIHAPNIVTGIDSQNLVRVIRFAMAESRLGDEQLSKVCRREIPFQNRLSNWFLDECRQEISWVEEVVQRMPLGEIWRNLILGNHSHLGFSSSLGIALFVKHCSDDCIPATGKDFLIGKVFVKLRCLEYWVLRIFEKCNYCWTPSADAEGGWVHEGES